MNSFVRRYHLSRWFSVVMLVLTLLTAGLPVSRPAQAADQFRTGSDGTLQLYEVRTIGDHAKNCENNTYKGGLFSSSDGGRTWQERGQQFNQNIVSVVSATADARAVYLLVTDQPITNSNSRP